MKLNELFAYDPDTGVLTWRVSRSNRIKIGQAAGSLHTNHKGKPYEQRYLHVRVDGKFIFVHRVIYEMMTGHPVSRNMQIDHANGDGTDNRWVNLRLATRSQNMMNRTRNRDRKHDLPKGVRWYEPGKLYHAVLAGKSIKYSKSLAEAKAAYDDAARQRYGEFARS